MIVRRRHPFYLGLLATTFLILPSLKAQSLEEISKLSIDAQEKIKNSQRTLSPEEIQEIRKHSELTSEEIVEEFPSNFSKERHARPSRTPNGALYINVYQESPVLINYTGSGNQVKKMSFEVITKYIYSSELQKVVPHFVRANLVSTGREGHRTSIGEFDIDRRHRYYVSQTYGSQMNFAQFFIGGIALHQTDEENYPILGGPASHGCVRHHELDAEATWKLTGAAIEDGNLINIKVFPFNAEVILADGSQAIQREGFGAELNQWLNNNIECTRRGDESLCSNQWNEWE